MGLLSILGSKKVIETVADTVRGGVDLVDKAFYTDQEKAEANAKIFDTWLKIQEATASENSIRSITRRILAWTITGTFLFLIMAACGLYHFMPSWSEYIRNCIVDTDLHWLTISVSMFYFGTYGIGNMIGKGKKK